ncbi:glutathione S-transferase E14-like [Phlebotomus papatasi]|uniref:glutathione S-transferase E14-like n=1 Tax=Phlebotomus papatasi TaxID=29031 RepID=UPI0024843CCB|nr:glutathione S-transferase E14-like [Phlebotomus papatasi]XP_055708197.1 glutathione S-transferase E14-like [Phlebotomus papatasi]
MRPVLFCDCISPPVRSIFLLIRELNLDVERRTVNLLKGENRHEDYLKVNPLHTVPVLKDQDIVLTDSHVILMYLCEKYGKSTNLFPKEDALRYTVLNRLFFNATLFFRRDSEMMGEIIRERRMDVVSKHRKNVQECFNYLETFLKEVDFMAGNHITIADFAILPTLSTVASVVPLEEEKWPRTFNWFNRMKTTLPYYNEENQAGLDQLIQSIRMIVGQGK